MAENLLLQKSQFALVAEELTDVYTCPVGRTNTVTLFLCNRALVATNFSIALALDGEADATKQYLYNNTTLPAANTMKVTITLNENDVIRVYVYADGVVSCNVFVDQSLKLRK
jgi:hypothetical protein